VNFLLPQRAFVQLAYRAYPFQQVMLDGSAVAVIPTALGLIGFWAEAGSHALQVTPYLSPLRQVMLLASALAALLASGLLLLSFFRQQRP
jgi:preprotein translocase subunit Sec61beta